MKGTAFPRYGALVAVAVVLGLLPLGIGESSFYMRLATRMLAFMAYGIAFNIIFGHTRQLFLCLGALAGCAGYLSVVMSRELGMDPWSTVPLGVLLSAGIGAGFSYIAVKRGLGIIFLGIVTLAFSLVFENLVLGLRTFTNGETGIVTSGLGFGFMQSETPGYYTFVAIVLLSLLLYHLLISSRIGLAFRALTDDELTAELAGINVTGYKVLAGAVGSALVGVVGAFYAFFNGFISPSVYSLVSVDVLVLVVLVLGGMATMVGPVLGGAAVTAINWLVRPLGALNLLVFGGLLVLLFLLLREGLVVVLRRASRLPVP